MAELALNDDQRDTFVGHLDGMRVAKLVRRESAADSPRRPRHDASRCAAAVDHRRPRVGPVITQNSGPTGQLEAAGEPRLQFLPGPVVQADLPAAPAFAASDQDRFAARVQVGLGKRECLADP